MADDAAKAGDQDPTQQEEGAAKILRSSDPDLTITLKYDDENGDAAVKDYFLHSQVISSLSKFVDTALAVEMKEKTERAITFHEVTPEIFDLAMKFQTDLAAVHSMTVEDAVRLVEFYDKYEFTGGLGLCDEVFFKLLESEPKALFSEQHPEDLDLLVEVAALADQCNLEKSRGAAISYLSDMLCLSPHDIIEWGARMFTVEHVRKLQPMFVKGAFPLCIPDNTTKEELESACFPKYLVSRFSHAYTRNVVRSVWVEGTNGIFDGEYAEVEQYRFLSMDMADLITKPQDGDWIMARKMYNDEDEEVGEMVLWKCPYSCNFEIPPEGPWLSVDPHALRMQPLVKYVLRAD